MQAADPHQLAPAMPPAVFRHFWLIAAAFMTVNVAVVARRIPAWVAAGAGTAEEGRRFLRATVMVLVVPGILMELLSLALGWSSPFCLTTAPWTPATTAVRAVAFASWLAIFAWAWSPSGADLLARFAPMLSRGGRPGQRFSTVNVRLVLGLMLIAGLVSIVMQSSPLFASTLPQDGPFACRAPSAPPSTSATAVPAPR